MAHSAAPPVRSAFGNLVAAIATIAVCDIAFGLTFPLLSLLLERRGVPAWIIGLNAAMSPLGIIIAGPIIPAAVRLIGARRLGHSSIFAMAGLLIGFFLFPSLLAWFILRFAFGVVAGTLYTLSEAWIVHFAEGPKRGRITGLYTSVVSITFSAGPLIIPYVDVEGIVPWLLGSVMVLVAGVPLMFLNAGDDFRPDKNQSVARFVRRAPLLLFAVLTLTMFDAVMLAFFIIYGLAQRARPRDSKLGARRLDRRQCGSAIPNRNACRQMASHQHHVAWGVHNNRHGGASAFQRDDNVDLACRLCHGDCSLCDLYGCSRHTG